VKTLSINLKWTLLALLAAVFVAIGALPGPSVGALAESYPALSPGVQASSKITAVGDYAHFTFTPSASGFYTFSSVESNTSGYIYDNALGKQINNDDTITLSLNITYYMTKGNTYTLAGRFGTRLMPSEKTGTFAVIINKTPTSGTEGSVKWSLDDNGTLTISGSGAMKDRYSVDTPWLELSPGIKRVEVKSGITYIGAYSFSYLTQLRSVSIASTVTGIGKHAFFNCDALEELTVPSNVTSMGERVFLDCSSLQRVVLPAGLSSIAPYMFSQCEALVSVNIPEGIKRIEDHAFYMCSALTSVEIPGSVTAIGEYAFQYCVDLESAILHSGVTTIASNAFECCYDLASIELPKSLTSVGKEAFYACRSLETVNYGGTATNWSAIAIGDGNGWLHRGAGRTVADSGSCGSGVSWSLSSKGVLTISGSGAMDDYSSTAYLNVIDGSTAPWSQYNKMVTRINIGSGVTHVGDYAFVTFASLDTAQLADTVQSLGKSAFYRSKIASIQLSASLKTIGDNCFLDTVNLMECRLPDGATDIGSAAFYLSGIRSVRIPASLKTIGDSAFNYCYDLKKVSYGGSEAQWGKIEIGSNNDPMSKAAIFYEDGSVSIPTSGSCGSGVKWSYSDGTLTISGKGAMNDYTESTGSGSDSIPWFPFSDDIGKIVIESGVTRVGNYAFNDCYNAKSASVASGVTAIGNFAFRRCGLTGITLPASVTSIGYGAFEECVALTKVTLPASLAVLPESCFFDCTALSKITLPSGLTTIGDGAFGNTVIRDLTIPASVTKVSEHAGLEGNYNHPCTIRFEGKLPAGLEGSVIASHNIYCPSQYFSSYRDLVKGYLSKLSWNAFSSTAPGIVCTGNKNALLSQSELTLNENCMSTRLTATVGGSSEGVSAKWSTTDSTSVAVKQDGTVTIQRYEGGAIVCAEVSCDGVLTLATCKVTCALSERNKLLLDTLPTEGITPNLIATNSMRTVSSDTGAISGYYPNLYVETDKTNPYYLEISELVKSLTKDCSTDREKTIAILKWVRANVVYSIQSLCIGETPSQVYAVYANGMGNCQGFSKLTGFMLSLANVPSAIAASRTHMWNLAFLGGKWYMLDSQYGSAAFYHDYSEEMYRIETITLAQGAQIYVVDSLGTIKLARIGQLDGSEGSAADTRVDLPDYTTTIFGGSLSNCTGMTEIHIPLSVTVIGSGAFKSCTKLTDVYYAGTAADWARISIAEDNGPLLKAKLRFAGATQSSYTTLNLPAGLMAVREESFAGLPVQRIVIPNGVSSIDARAFANCKKLVQVVIPDSVTQIADNAFDGCSNVTVICSGSSIAAYYCTTHGLTWKVG